VNESGDSISAVHPLFQEEGDGSTPISPLQLQLKLIPAQLALNIYRKWHYLKGISFISAVNLGAFFDGAYHGAISYGPPNATELADCFDRKTQDGWWEIKRFALSPRCQRNSESRMIGISIKLLRRMEYVKGIVTYADSQQGHDGGIYKATGFTYMGLTELKKDFVMNGVIQQRGRTKGLDGTWVPRSQKHLFVKRLT
jgi:hypothetical protein